jgi:hypothetical protein
LRNSFSRSGASSHDTGWSACTQGDGATKARAERFKAANSKNKKKPAGRRRAA